MKKSPTISLTALLLGIGFSATNPCDWYNNDTITPSQTTQPPYYSYTLTEASGKTLSRQAVCAGSACPSTVTQLTQGISVKDSSIAECSLVTCCQYKNQSQQSYILAFLTLSKTHRQKPG